MHNAKLNKSERLKRVLKLLSSAYPGALSTRQIIARASVCAVNSIVAELRANGKRILCTRRGGNWYYRLVR